MAINSKARHDLFQFTPLREGRPRHHNGACKGGNFNSRPSARGDSTVVPASCAVSISIHAPPRGATVRLFQIVSEVGKISIHAPPRGATASSGRQLYPLYFNSRPSARGDDGYAPCEVIFFISIHAPPRGATARKAASAKAVEFQFTPLREGRRRLDVIGDIASDFNSRPSARGDPKTATKKEEKNHISIHAPPRGATRACRFLVFCGFPFQFTPLREGRHAAGRAIEAADISIHAPPRGATRHLAWLRGPAPYFNSRPSARGDELADRIARSHAISIHAPPRGATLVHGHPQHGGRISIHAPPRGATAKDMQFLQIFCSTLTNQHGLTIVPGNLSRLFW